GAMVVAGAEGFRKNQYRKFSIKSEDLTPGDDYAMMREVLTRRFKRLLNETPRVALPTPDGAVVVDSDAASPWPDLVLVDGGAGQLAAAQEVLTTLGVA